MGLGSKPLLDLAPCEEEAGGGPHVTTALPFRRRRKGKANAKRLVQGPTRQHPPWGGKGQAGAKTPHRFGLARPRGCRLASVLGRPRAGTTVNTACLDLSTPPCNHGHRAHAHEAHTRKSSQRPERGTRATPRLPVLQGLLKLKQLPQETTVTDHDDGRSGQVAGHWRCTGTLTNATPPLRCRVHISRRICHQLVLALLAQKPAGGGNTAA